MTEAGGPPLQAYLATAEVAATPVDLAAFATSARAVYASARAAARRAAARAAAPPLPLPLALRPAQTPAEGACKEGEGWRSAPTADEIVAMMVAQGASSAEVNAAATAADVRRKVEVEGLQLNACRPSKKADRGKEADKELDKGGTKDGGGAKRGGKPTNKRARPTSSSGQGSGKGRARERASDQGMDRSFDQLVMRYGSPRNRYHLLRSDPPAPPGWQAKGNAAEAAQRAAGKKVVVGEDVVLTFAFFSSHEKTPPSLDRHVMVLPDTPLERLRCVLCCYTDELLARALAEPAANPAGVTQEDAESAYFIMGGVLFDDGDEPANAAVAWLASRHPTAYGFERHALTGSTLEGMTLRPGEDMVYCHGGCVHALVLTDVRLAHSGDPQMRADYPKVARLTHRWPVQCSACGEREAEYTARDPDLSTVAALCPTCLRMLYADAKGAPVLPAAIERGVAFAPFTPNAQP